MKFVRIGLSYLAATAAGLVLAGGEAIGVFDSGTGGLTVFEQMLTQDVLNNTTWEEGADGIPDFAGERFVFLADSANMSYGVYPSEGRTDYLRDLVKNDARFVLGDRYYRDASEPEPTDVKPRAKIVVIACNTATAYGLDDVRQMLDGSGISVVGVINAGSKAAIDAVRGGGACAIGVLATRGTISSGAYERTIREILKADDVRQEVEVVNQAGYGLSESVDRMTDFFDETLTAPRPAYKGPRLGTGEGAIDLSRLDGYAFDFSCNRMLTRREGDRIVELQLNSPDNYVRYNFLSLVEKLRATGKRAPLKALILGCTHFPYLTANLAKFAAELREKPAYRDLIDPDLKFIDPAVYTALECHRALREQNRLARTGEMSAEAYISVPSADLPKDLVGKDGRLTYEFRYSRKIGEPRGTKEVPLAQGCVDPAVLERLRLAIPTTYGMIVKPVKVAVFAGCGPRSNGATEWFRLVNESPDLELKLVDGEMIRNGALDDMDMIVMPGGSSKQEWADLGKAGAERLKAFIRAGGGYIGTCAGCSLLLCHAVNEEFRRLEVLPFRRLGSKDSYMLPIKFTANGKAALGLSKNEYAVRYHGGPIVEPVTTPVEGAAFEVWGTFAEEFGKPDDKLSIYGHPAVFGGTYGKGRVFAIASHPENYVETREIVRGAFRYVAGRDVRFPERKRVAKSLTVGFFTPVISGIDVARSIVTLDSMEGIDFFPLDKDYLKFGLLDHVDVLILPDGNAQTYGKNKDLIVRYATAFAERGGAVFAWGEGAKMDIPGMRTFGSSAETLSAVKDRISR